MDGLQIVMSLSSSYLDDDEIYRSRKGENESEANLFIFWQRMNISLK